MRTPLLEELPPPGPEKAGWPWTVGTPHDAVPASDRPRITIVTPSYNQAEYLEETIRSVLLQGYPDLEYIIIDGGSSDASVDVIRKYEPWLSYWVSERDNGQSAAINKGLARSSGAYVNYVNSDDRLEPGALQAVASAFASCPTADVVYGKCVLADQEGRRTSVYQGRGDTADELFASLLAGDSLHPLAMFFRRGALVRAGGFDEQLHHEMDAALWFQLFAQGCQIHRIAAEIGMFRCYRDQKSASHRRIDELYAVLLDAIAGLPARSTEGTERLRRTLSRECAHRKLWAASSACARGQYRDYLACCADALMLAPSVAASWIFWTNLLAPVKRVVPRVGMAALRSHAASRRDASSVPELRH